MVERRSRRILSTWTWEAGLHAATLDRMQTTSPIRRLVLVPAARDPKTKVRRMLLVPKTALPKRAPAHSVRAP